MKKQIEKTIEREDKSEIKIIIKRPNNNLLKASDRERARVWNECLLDNILTKKELDLFMEKRGIWDKEKQKKEKGITKEITDLELKLYRGENGKRPSLSRGKELAIQMRQKRVELLNLITERNALQENTAEALADNAKFDYLVAHCTYQEDGETLFFASLDDYNNNAENDIAFAAGTALGEIMYNLDSDFEMNLPENKFLKKFNLVDEKGTLCDADGNLVDVEGKIVDKEGYYLDEKGNRVDKNGVPLTEDGEYEIVDYVDDLTPKKKTVRKTTKTTAKKTETSDSE